MFSDALRGVWFINSNVVWRYNFLNFSNPFNYKQLPDKFKNLSFGHMNKVNNSNKLSSS